MTDEEFRHSLDFEVHYFAPVCVSVLETIMDNREQRGKIEDNLFRVSDLLS